MNTECPYCNDPLKENHSLRLFENLLYHEECINKERHKRVGEVMCQNCFGRGKITKTVSNPKYQMGYSSEKEQYIDETKICLECKGYGWRKGYYETQTRTITETKFIPRE
jgi:hypothetical protein